MEPRIVGDNEWLWKGKTRYYVAIGGVYLHNDGIARINAIVDGKDSGWYDTKRDARKAIRKYRELNTPRFRVYQAHASSPPFKWLVKDCNKTGHYLHSDGVSRLGTFNPATNVYSGWFYNRQSARNAVKLACSKMHA